MCTNRTDFRSLLADTDVTAFCTFPDSVAVFGEYQAVFYIGEQFTITFFMCLFNFADSREQIRNAVKALFLGNGSEFLVHVSPFVVFPFRSSSQVLSGIRDFSAAEQLKPKFCMFFFVVGSFFKNLGNLYIAVFFCLGSKVGVLIACLRFTSESGH